MRSHPEPRTQQPEPINPFSRHDIVGALRTIRFASDELNGGYRFEDDSADEKIRALVRAISILENHLLEKLTETR